MRSFSFLRFGRRLLADEVLLRLDRFDRDRCIEPPGVSMELLVEPRALLWVLRGVMVGSGGETMELDLDSDTDDSLVASLTTTLAIFLSFSAASSCLAGSMASSSF